VLIAGVAIGLLTAYYFGIRFGIYAAVGSTVAFFAALIMPGYRWPLYGVVTVFVLGVVVLGPKLGKPMANVQVIKHARKATSWLRKRVGK